MTNEEKAKEIGAKYTYTNEVLHYDLGEPCYFTETFGEETNTAALEMAEWKDQQFKEFLERKKGFLFNVIPSTAHRTRCIPTLGASRYCPTK